MPRKASPDTKFPTHTGRTIPPQTRAMIRLLRDQGKTYREIQAATGVSRKTATSIVNSSETEIESATRQSTKETVLTGLRGLSGMLLEELMKPERIASANFRDLAVALGIALDKAHQMEAGAAQVNVLVTVQAAVDRQEKKRLTDLCNAEDAEVVKPDA